MTLGPSLVPFHSPRYPAGFAIPLVIVGDQSALLTPHSSSSCCVVFFTASGLKPDLSELEPLSSPLDPSFFCRSVYLSPCDSFILPLLCPDLNSPFFLLGFVLLQSPRRRRFSHHYFRIPSRCLSPPRGSAGAGDSESECSLDIVTLKEASDYCKLGIAYEKRHRSPINDELNLASARTAGQGTE